MNESEMKAKYSRIAEDPSQLEMFKNDVIDGKVIEGLPESEQGDEGKALVVGADGTPAWQPLPAAGTKLYLHKVRFKDTNDAGLCQVEILSNVTTGINRDFLKLIFMRGSLSTGTNFYLLLTSDAIVSTSSALSLHPSYLANLDAHWEFGTNGPRSYFYQYSATPFTTDLTTGVTTKGTPTQVDSMQVTFEDTVTEL